MSETKVWTTTVQEDPENPDELMIVFPDELMEQVGWKVGDTINWDMQPDGTAVLTKKAA
jgi:hypothetical protein